MKKDIKEKTEQEIKNQMLLASSSIKIKTSSQDILKAYGKQREALTEKKETDFPFYKRKGFLIPSSLALAATIVGVSFGINSLLSSSSPLYAVPLLTDSSKKLIFGMNNAASLLNNESPSIAILSQIKNAKGSESDNESLNDIAENYLALSSLLDRSSKEDGSFTKNASKTKGKAFKYRSASFGYSLSTDYDPLLLNGSFTGNLTFTDAFYTFKGTEDTSLLSLSLFQSKLFQASFKEETTGSLSLFTLSYKSSTYTDEIGFQGDFTSAKNSSPLTFTRKITDSTSAVSSYSFSSSLSNDGKKAQISYKLVNGNGTLEGSMKETKQNDSYVFSFDGFSYSISLKLN